MSRRPALGAAQAVWQLPEDGTTVRVSSWCEMLAVATKLAKNKMFFKGKWKRFLENLVFPLGREARVRRFLSAPLWRPRRP